MIRTRLIIAPALLLAALAAAGGCQQALFPDDAPRHQFEAHDVMRGTAAPLEEPDVFGNPQPALRSRLSRTH